MSADLSHIGFQPSSGRWRGNRNTNEEELEGENTGGESLKRPTNEKPKQEFESPAQAEIESQGKQETTPPQIFGSGHEAQGRHKTAHFVLKKNVEKEEDDRRTRGHELYLRYLLLLLQAAHLALKGFLGEKVNDRNSNLADLIINRRGIFENRNREEFQLLFKEERINTNIESWDTRLLCVVILVLFHSESHLQQTEYEAVECILDHRNDLENYVQSASLNFYTFKAKWKSLHDAIIELIKVIDKKFEFECKRMIHSYEPGSIIISSEVIRNLKKTHVVNMHAKIALQNFNLKHGKQGCQDKGQLQNVGIKFTEMLQDKFVYVDDPTILTCKLNVSEDNFTWQHDNKHIEDSDTMKILRFGCCHWLAISRAKLEDAGKYTFACRNASTTAYLSVSEHPLMVIKKLHVSTEEEHVRENMDIVLVCKVSHNISNVTWRHNGEVIHSNRHHTSLDGNVHKLTILKAKYEDEGEYTVDFRTTKSRTDLTLKGKRTTYPRESLIHDFLFILKL